MLRDTATRSEPRKGAKERISVERVCNLKVYCSACKARKYYSPSLWCRSCNSYVHRSEIIYPCPSERWFVRCGPVLREWCHNLRHFWSVHLLANNAFSDGRFDSSKTSQDPISLSECSNHMFYTCVSSFPMRVFDYQSCQSMPLR